MITTKIYNQRLDLKDVSSIYTPKERICMKLLREKYENKCFKGSYILEIKDIRKISDVSISSSHLDVRGELWTSFTAKILQYSKNDLITDCKIIKKIRNIVLGKTKYGNVILKSHDLLKLIQEGDYIPIIIQNAKYKVFENNVSILATPFTPNRPKQEYIYILNEAMTLEEVNKIKSYVESANKLKMWVENLKSVDAKKFKDFDKLFYPFKKQEKPSLLITNKKDVNLLDFLTKNYDEFKQNFSPILIILSSKINRSKPFVLSANIKSKENIEKQIEKEKEKEKEILKYNIIQEKSYIVFESLFISYIQYLTFLQNMVKEYGVIKETDPYYRAIMSYKI